MATTSDDAFGFTGSGADVQFREGLEKGRFLVQRCSECNQFTHYPRSLCPHCGAAALTWVVPSGRGTVYATTTVRRSPAQGGPYNVAIVELEEGPRLMTRVEGIDVEDVRIGLAVAARIDRAEDGAVLVFVPAVGHDDRA